MISEQYGVQLWPHVPAVGEECALCGDRAALLCRLEGLDMIVCGSCLLVLLAELAAKWRVVAEFRRV